MTDDQRSAKTIEPREHRTFMLVLVTVIVGPFIYALISSFAQLPPATFVIRHTVRSDGRYPVYATSMYTFMLMECTLMVVLLPALVVKKLLQRVNS